MEGLEDHGEERGAWLSQAMMTVRVAEEMLLGDLYRDTVANSFLAMLYAAREVVAPQAGAAVDWEEVIRLFQELAPRMGLSPENRRALPIVAELYRRVVEREEEEADPLTASACLDDARAFVREIGERTGLA